MATKRRKVWVAFYGNGEFFSFTSQRQAKSDASDVVKMVETRPGDVVLSREDVAEMRELLARALEQNDDEAAHELRALLRGGR